MGLEGGSAVIWDGTPDEAAAALLAARSASAGHKGAAYLAK